MLKEVMKPYLWPLYRCILCLTYALRLRNILSLSLSLSLSALRLIEINENKLSLSLSLSLCVCLSVCLSVFPRSDTDGLSADFAK